MKIGLITYHSAYNFGSVLQAYASQHIINRIAGDCEIINYRTKEQRRVYSPFVWNKGREFVKSLIKNILAFPQYKCRKLRSIKYETLFTKLFNLSDECTTPEAVYSMWNKYDIIVSGSDQIWNKYSNELAQASWSNIEPYLLNGYKGKKISFASSIGNMPDSEITKLVDYINEFDYVSMREKESADKLRSIVTVDVENVVDPTFLLTKEEWRQEFHLTDVSEKYILYYALNRRRDVKEARKAIEIYAKKKRIKVRMIDPLGASKSSEYVDVLNSIDPIEFLQLIYGAETIITDSYHGTILSVNLEKDVFSICGKNKSDFRKTDILKQIGLSDRIISNINDIIDNEFESIQYDAVKEKLYPLIQNSKRYLYIAFGVKEDEV